MLADAWSAQSNAVSQHLSKRYTRNWEPRGSRPKHKGTVGIGESPDTLDIVIFSNM